MVRTGLISLGILIIAIIGFFIFSRMNKNIKEGFSLINPIILFNFAVGSDKEKPRCIFIDKSDNTIIYSIRAATSAIPPILPKLCKLVIDGNNNATLKSLGPIDSTNITTNFDCPYIVKDSRGSIYFQNVTNINKLELSTGIVSNIAGNGTVPYSGTSVGNYINTLGDTTAYRENQLATNVPLGRATDEFMPLAIDSANSIYIYEPRISKEDTILKLRKLTLSGTTYNISTFRITLPSDIHNTFTFPTGTSLVTNIVEMVFDSSDILYVACQYHIFKVELNSTKTAGTATIYAGSKTSTTPTTSTGDGADAKSATLVGIVTIALDSSDNLYITDDLSIRKIDKSTNIITTYLRKNMVGITPANNNIIPTVPLKKISFDSFDNLYAIYGWGSASAGVLKIPSSCKVGQRMIIDGANSYCSYISDISKLPRNTKGSLLKATQNVVSIDPTKPNDPNTFIYKWAGNQGSIDANPCKDPSKKFFNFDTLTCEATGNPVIASTPTPTPTAPAPIGTAPACAKGQQYVLANQQCEACPAGTYQDLTNGNKCRICTVIDTVPNSTKDACIKNVSCCPTPANKSFSYIDVYTSRECGSRYFNTPRLSTKITPIQRNTTCKGVTINTPITPANQICFDLQGMFKLPCTNLPPIAGFEDMSAGETIYSKRAKWFENRRILNSA